MPNVETPVAASLEAPPLSPAGNEVPGDISGTGGAGGRGHRPRWPATAFTPSDAVPPLGTRDVGDKLGDSGGTSGGGRPCCEDRGGDTQSTMTDPSQEVRTPDVDGTRGGGSGTGSRGGCDSGNGSVPGRPALTPDAR